MGLQPVTASAALPDDGGPQDWTLADEIAIDTQGIVVRGFGKLKMARAFFLDCSKAPGGGWLSAVAAIAPITTAKDPTVTTDGQPKPAAMIAFTHSGLAVLGVPPDALRSFLLPFQEGMLRADRRHRLGDDDGEPNTITRGGLAWSGNEQTPATPRTVHALLVLYDASVETLGVRADAVGKVLEAAGVGIRPMELDLRVDERGIAREHFGFSDGISQPIPYGDGVIGPAKIVDRDPIHGVPLGEILLGHANAHGEIPPGPVVSHPVAVESKILMGTPEPVATVLVATNPLKPIKGTDGLHDLGLNGSYLVVRELKQDVAAFWDSLEREALSLNTRAGPAEPPVSADWVAERVVGRTKDGHLLGPKEPWPALEGNEPDNTPLYFKTDRHGFGCPMGSHVRRANPRDGLAGDPSACGDLLNAANAHRILRRGRKFGPDTTVVDGKIVPDDENRGLLFMCLNTDIVRQFEFVQQNWLLNPNFATLLKEVDPLVGPAGKMTLPRQPLRRTVNVDTYVTLTGGDYFFLPSLRALSYFETLIGPK